MTRLPAAGRRNGSQLRQDAILGASGNKYGAITICACGHPRWAHQGESLTPGACRDMDCGCQQWKKRYDSLAEAQRGAELEAMERAGEIKELRRQVRYPLFAHRTVYRSSAPPGVEVCEYRADFVYRVGSEVIVEDCKGVATPLYRLKKKMMAICYGIEIQEVHM